MSFDFILIYTATIFIATIVPGPSMLLALTHGMQFGAKRTVASAMGNLVSALTRTAAQDQGVQ